MSLDFVGTPNFDTRPGSARHSSARRSRTSSRAGSIETRLPIIDEDHPSPPLPFPPQAHHRPFSRRFLGEPPRYSNGHSPPKYSFFDVTGPKGEKFEDLRNNVHIANRGGWRRLCIILLVVLVLVLALAIGLGVGLRERNKNSATPSAPASASSSATPSPGPFPAGSYTLTTFLDTASTNCTSDASSWKCEPAVTYANDPAGAEATFNWIVTASNSKPPDFSISSTDNPFAIDFANATLNLIDAGTADERYSFTTTVQKVVFPSFNVKCFYNNTQFLADMYTRRAKSYPSNGAAASASPTSPADSAAVTAVGQKGGSFSNWNYAMDATQSIGGGEDVPACYEYSNGQVGARITNGYTAEPSQDFCACAYKNYDPTG